MKKRSKIYTDEKSIIAAIDSKKSELIGLAERAEQLDANKKKHYKNHYDLSVKAESLKGKKQKDCEDEATEQKKLAHDCEDLGRKVMKRHKRISETTLPKLSQALAAFKTDTMTSIMDSYRGVAVA